MRNDNFAVKLKHLVILSRQNKETNFVKIHYSKFTFRALQNGVLKHEEEVMKHSRYI